MGREFYYLCLGPNRNTHMETKMLMDLFILFMFLFETCLQKFFSNVCVKENK